MSRGKQIVSKLKSLVYVSVGGIGVFSGYQIYNGNEQYYENFLMPVVQKIDPEVTHTVALIATKYHLIPKSTYEDNSCLSAKVWHLDFKNPVGVAAGFDKQGEAIVGLDNQGFGFVEIGSVTPKPQSGNVKPRVFRLPENSAIINRYGFNSEGYDKVYDRLYYLRLVGKFKGIVGVNLGKNKNSLNPVDDYVQGVEKFGSVADYLVINISSPNTPGLRDWQAKDHLKDLLSKLVTARNSITTHPQPLLLLKLAPDLTRNELTDISDVINNAKCRVDGLIISNTTVERDKSLVGPHISEPGGLSGLPLNNRSTEMISDMYTLTKGKIPIIGVGGIFSGQDAYDKIKAGASLVQFYTAFIYHGPPRVTRIKRELAELLQNDGYKSVNDAVGKNVKL